MKRLGIPVLAGVAVLAVIAAGLLAVRSYGRRSPASPGGTSQYAVTLRAVQRLLAAAPTPPGSRPADHPPVPALRRPATTVESPNFVDRGRSWTAPGSAAAALTYLRGHLPAGLTADGSGEMTAANQPTVYTLQDDATGPRWRRPSAYTGLQLQFSVARASGGVAVRADAQAVWLPPRSAAERIPANVRSVTLIVRRPGSKPTVRRTLGAPAARRLARLVNSQPAAEPGTANCGMDRGFTDTLVFGPIIVSVEVGGCDSVTVTSHGRPQPALDGDGTLDSAVTAALGLPPDYGE